METEKRDVKIWQGYFQGSGGLKLYYEYWSPREAKDVMILHHGHGEHIGRYRKFREHLAGRRVALAAYDARGTGRSEGKAVYVDSFDEFLQDLSAFRQFLEIHYGVSGKVILFGHSMGGLAAFHWALKNPEAIKGLILSSPCLGMKLSPPLRLMNRWLNRLAPGFEYRNPVYPPYLTHNVEEVKSYEQDSLIRRKITVRLLDEMINYSSRLNSSQAIVLPFPVYILMAGLEKVVDKDKTLEIYRNIEAPRKKIYCFDEFYHEIFNELGQEKAFKALHECLTDLLNAA